MINASLERSENSDFQPPRHFTTQLVVRTRLRYPYTHCVPLQRRLTVELGKFTGRFVPGLHGREF